MDSFESVLGRAAGGALCNVLKTYGSAAPLLTAVSLIEPTPIGEVAAVTSGLAALAANAGCTWDTEGPGPPDEPGYAGCQKFSEGFGIWSAFRIDLNQRFPQYEVTETLSFGITTGATGSPVYRHVYLDEDKVQRSSDFLVSTFKDFRCDPSASSGAVCENPAPTPGPPTPDPYNYTDDETGCSLTVNFQGWGLDQAGRGNAIFQIAPADEVLRADGGIIGGCNFNPVIYVDDGGNGGGGSGPNLPSPFAPVPPGGPLQPDFWVDVARDFK